MPGPLESARVGSGGITAHIGFNMDRQELLKVLGDAKKTTADYFKEMKGKVVVDVDENATMKAMRKMLGQIESEIGKTNAKLRLQAAGLIPGTVQQAIRPLSPGAIMPGQGLRGGLVPESFNRAAPPELRASPELYGLAGISNPAQAGGIAATKDVYGLAGLVAPHATAERNALAKEIQRIRRDTAKYAAKVALFGEDAVHVAQLGGMHNFDSMVGLTSSARFGATSGREGRFSGMSDVPMSPEFQARQSLKEAQKQTSLRADAEAKFAKELEEETEENKQSRNGGGGRSSGGHRRALSYARDVLFVGRQAERILSAAGDIGAGYLHSNRLQGIGNTQATVAGRLLEQQTSNSLPFVGPLFKIVDELQNISRGLQAQTMANQDIRNSVVESARLTFNPVFATEAQSREMIQQSQDKYAMLGIDVNKKGLSAFGEGNLPATDAEYLAIRAHRGLVENRGKVDARALLESKAENYQRSARTAGDVLRSRQQPWLAKLTEFDAETEVLVRLGDPAKQEAIRKERGAMRMALSAERERGLGSETFNSQINIAANEMRVKNKGLNLENEQALRLIGGLQNAIDIAPEEGGFRRRAQLTALSSARAFKASLMVRGGGVVGQSNLFTQATQNADPFNIEPQSKARLEAMGEINQYIRSMGGDRAFNQQQAKSVKDFNPGDLLITVEKIYEVIRDTVLTGKPKVIMLAP